MSPADPEDRDDSAGYPAESAAESAALSAAGAAPLSAADSAAFAAAFDDIVAGWRAEGDVPDWPADRMPGGRHRATPIAPEADRTAPSPVEPTTPPGTDQAAPRAGDQQPQRPVPPRSYAPLSSDDDHFVPPEPPPLPRIGRAAAVGMGLIAIGLTLLLAPGLLGIAESVGLTLGLLTVAGGLGWLVLGSWAGDPPSDPYDDDDGAVF